MKKRQDVNIMIDLPDFDAKGFIEKASIFIETMIKNAGADGVVLGLSGGIDSAVVAYLCVKALGSSKVHAFILPSNTTSNQDIEDALLVEDELKIDTKSINIADLYDKYVQTCEIDQTPRNNETLAKANIKPRIRMTIIYYYATLYNSLVIGTGNKTELSVGYFTKNGDGGVDLLPIGDLYKQDVIKLAQELGVPESIINKPPTAGLLPDQTDENELGMTYVTLDKLLYMYLEKNSSLNKISEELGLETEEVKRIVRLYENSEHKRNTPPVLSK